MEIVKKEQDGIVVVNISGRLDATTSIEAEQIITPLTADEGVKLVFNLQDLEYISSAGLGVFMAYVETMREHNGDIKFSNLKEDVYNIFDLLGFPVLYEFFDKEEDAILKFDQ